MPRIIIRQIEEKKVESKRNAFEGWEYRPVEYARRKYSYARLLHYGLYNRITTDIDYAVDADTNHAIRVLEDNAEDPEYYGEQYDGAARFCTKMEFDIDDLQEIVKGNFGCISNTELLLLMGLFGMTTDSGCKEQPDEVPYFIYRAHLFQYVSSRTNFRIFDAKTPQVLQHRLHQFLQLLNAFKLPTLQFDNMFLYVPGLSQLGLSEYMRQDMSRMHHVCMRAKRWQVVNMGHSSPSQVSGCVISSWLISLSPDLLPESGDVDQDDVNAHIELSLRDREIRNFCLEWAADNSRLPARKHTPLTRATTYGNFERKLLPLIIQFLSYLQTHEIVTI